MKLATDVERVAISKVVVGVRRRQKLGNIRAFSRSIEQRGLLHPILLRNGVELVSGQRRLEACKLLGWTTIPARHIESMSDEEFRAVELEENTEREALLDYETSKQRLAEIRQIEADAKAEELRPEPGRKGRPREPGSERDVSERTGVSRPARERIEKHVAVAEAHPFMQKPEWRQHNVLEAAEHLEKLPERDRSSVAALLDQPGIPPKKAIKILEHVAEMKPAERKEVFTLAKSEDAMDRRTALTKAAELPPPPDPGLVNFYGAARMLRDGARVTRIVSTKPKAEAIAVAIDKLIERAKKESGR